MHGYMTVKILINSKCNSIYNLKIDIIVSESFASSKQGGVPSL